MGLSIGIHGTVVQRDHPLGMTNSSLLNMEIYSRKTQYHWPFAIAMLVLLVITEDFPYIHRSWRTVNPIIFDA